MVTAHEGVAERADTLRWAASGELRFCDCEVCWSHERFWRYAELVAGHAARAAPPGPGRGPLADGVWGLLTAPWWRRVLWRFTAPALGRSVKALREAAVQERWNRAQLYEAVLRGLALHWERTRAVER